MENEIAILIPIFSIIFGCVLGGFSMFINWQKRRLLHEERMVALEKGLEPPEDPISKKDPVLMHKNAALANRKAFVILFFTGIAFMSVAQESDFHSVGIIMIIVSFAFLTISTFKFKLNKEEKKYYETKRDFGPQLSSSNPMEEKITD